MTQIELYDATLRDGMGGGGLSLTAEEKVRLVHRLDDLGVAPHRGRLPGVEPQGGRALRAARARDARQRDDRRLRDDPPARRRGVAGRRPARAGRLLRAGHDDRRQDLDAARREGRARLARGEPRDDRRVRRVPRRAGQARDLRRRAPLRRPARRPRLRARVPARGRRARAPSGSCCATPTARRCRARSPPPSPTSRAALPGVALGIHCHDDGGCAVANSLMAVEAGATQVQGTINGIGERTGNANLITIIANLQLKMGHRVVSDEQLRRLTETAHFADELLNRQPDAGQPYVGKHAFAHKAGLHAAGIRADATTFEHIDPALVGNRRDLLVSELSGKGTVADKAEARGPRARRRRRRARARADEGAGARRLPVRGRRRLVRAAAAQGGRRVRAAVRARLVARDRRPERRRPRRDRGDDQDQGRRRALRAHGARQRPRPRARRRAARRC